MIVSWTRPTNAFVLARRPLSNPSVATPAKAGVHTPPAWIPVFTGMTEKFTSNSRDTPELRKISRRRESIPCVSDSLDPCFRRGDEARADYGLFKDLPGPSIHITAGRRCIMPIVKVEMFAGRSKEQKAELAKAITDAVVDIARTTADETIVIFTDVERENWARGGTLASER